MGYTGVLLTPMGYTGVLRTPMGYTGVLRTPMGYTGELRTPMGYTGGCRGLGVGMLPRSIQSRSRCPRRLCIRQVDNVEFPSLLVPLVHPPVRRPSAGLASFCFGARSYDAVYFIGSFGFTSRPLRPLPHTSVSPRSFRFSRHDIPSCTASYTECYACGMVSHATTWGPKLRDIPDGMVSHGM